MPSIFEYLDCLQYLTAYYAFRKSQQAKFSYEKWAEELNFKSRSYLRMILIGRKKISSTFCDAFSQASQFSAIETEYLQILAKYSQSATTADRQIFGSRLIEIIKTQAPRDNIQNQISFVGNPLHARLLILTGFEDLELSAQNFSKILQMSELEIEQALFTLENLGLVEKKSSGLGTQWQTTHKKFTVTETLGSENLMKFHEKSMLDAIEAFHQPREQRRYRSLLLPMNEEELKEYYSLMENFAQQQLTRFQANTSAGRKLFQVNMNVFAVTTEMAKLTGQTNEDSEMTQ